MSLFAETGLTTVLFLAALALTIWFLLMRSNRYFNRRSESQEASFRIDAPAAKPRGHHLDAPTSMVQWEVEMHETARELSGQLDTKLGLLQQLIREADRAAARLEAAVAAARAQAAEHAPAQETDQADAAVPAFRPAAPQDRDRFQPLAEGANQAEALKAASHGEPRDPAGASGRAQSSASSSENASRQHRFQEIYTLADYGLDAAEIAQRLGTPVGEVELILGLRGKK